MVSTQKRFIIADSIVAESLGLPGIVVLSSIDFWTDNYEDLIAWCANNNADVQGMTVNIHDEKTLTAFCLRWS
jgi:hypothetical protein